MARYQDELDAEAFQEIVSRFLSPALAVAHQILSDRTLAEDAVQETFLRIVRRRERYIASRPFSNWFYAILRNVCKDILRHRARQRKLIEEVAIRNLAQAQPSFDPPGGSELLARLPKEARVVLVLRIIHEMPFRDIAAALDISEEAAKKRAQRALQQLRKEHTAWPVAFGLPSGGTKRLV
ncbi:MAG: sigma-70 family RNA polymerase sigma factor [Planctomycetes bacterium]|nr:sigma-70 family RNA polymerase sigma factor [Planctomycetota bacterium]